MNQRRWGALLSYVNIILTVAVGLLYTPLMLRLLGQSEYGLYSLIGSVIGYLSVLDMGLGNTLVPLHGQKSCGWYGATGSRDEWFISFGVFGYWNYYLSCGRRYLCQHRFTVW